MYEVIAVVTHKGREAEAGHYVGWVRTEEDKWLTFDDDVVTPCNSADIEKLRFVGGWAGVGR